MAGLEYPAADSSTMQAKEATVTATPSEPKRNPRAADTEKRYQVTRADLPLACPMPDMGLWNSHPRVYLPIEKTGEAACPYCGARFVLKED